MSLGYLVAELFEPNCRICFTFHKQDSHAFTAHNDAAALNMGNGAIVVATASHRDGLQVCQEANIPLGRS
jgi:hypothetical protein